MNELEVQPTTADDVFGRAATERMATAMVERGGEYLAHSTEDGPILLIPRRSCTSWTVLIEGHQLSAGATGSSRLAALSEAEASFREMFPEHKCTSECSWRLRGPHKNRRPCT